MTDIALRFDGVWKKFRRGEHHDSLRDLVPSLFRRAISGKAVALQDQEFWALQNLSFQVKRGEALGIIGPNGSGKSTTLKLLSGILRPTRGKVQLNGRLSPLIEVGAGFHPDLTGRENIYLNGAILGMTRAGINKKLDEIIDFSGISEFIDTPVKRYSSGMYARLGFSIAAHVDPEILLVDEVLSVGDYTFQGRCINKMEEILKRGTTVIFVSHNMGPVISLCNKALLLVNGLSISEGEPSAVVAAYYNRDATLTPTYSKERKAYIKETRIDGLPLHAAVLEPGSRIRVEVTVEAKADCSLSPGLFLSQDGTAVFDTTYGLMTGGSFRMVEGQQAVFCWTLDLNLPGGIYNLGLHLEDADTGVYHQYSARTCTLVIGENRRYVGKYHLNPSVLLAEPSDGSMHATEGSRLVSS